jgi:hypothetical protein
MLAATLTDTQGLVAIGAAAVALIAIAWCIALTVSLRSAKRAQSVVFGQQGTRDLVEHAAALEQAFEALRAYSSDIAQTLESRLMEVEQSLLGTISHRALVHYDAYNELSGRQSMSIALLDGTRSGIVISCIHHRDQARVYAKRVQGGAGEVELSPEEAEAVRLAGTSGAPGDDAFHHVS